ncbi:MAG: ATP-binding protein [bacterium]
MKNYFITVIILIFLLGLFFILSIRNSQRVMLSFFEEEARSFLKIIALAQENSIFAEAEFEGRIADNLLSIISYIDEAGYDHQTLERMRQNFHLSSIVIYDEIQRKVISESGIPYAIDTISIEDEKKINYYYFSVLNKKFIRFIYRVNQRILQIELSAENIKRFSQEYGIGKILNQMADNPLVQYILLQDLQGIIFATPNIRTMPKIENDPALLRALNNGEEITRIINFGNKKVLEIVQPFVVEQNNIGLFRIGMNLDNYHQHVKNTYFQLAVIFIVLLIGGIFIFSIFYKYQDYQMRLQFFTHILGAIDEGVLLVDNKDKITGNNKMFSSITETQGTLLFNQHYSDKFNDDPFSINLVRQTGVPFEEEKEMFQKIVKYATYPIFGINKKLVGTISILHNVTELRKQEKEQEEKERLSFLGNLVANFAHEIKNPLNGLAIAAQRLQREYPSQNEEYGKLISIIIKEIDSMNRILNDFLSLARPQIKEYQTFDLSQLVKDVGMLIKQQLDQKGIRYNEKIEEGIVCEASAEDIKRVLINLLLNATEAVSSLVDRKPEISISLMHKAKNIVIEINDNGTGIPEAALKKIFEPYYTTKKGGTGLGLYIAQKIVNEHNGKIRAQSIQGKGTTFTVILPCRR